MAKERLCASGQTDLGQIGESKRRVRSRRFDWLPCGAFFARYQVQLALLLIPFLAGAIILIVLPALAMTALAFTRYDALSPPQWVGLENFVTLFRREIFWIAVWNSLRFAALAVPLQVLGAFALALFLYAPHRGVRPYRITAYLPSVIPDVAYALIWLWLLNPLYGPINRILGGIGLPQPAWLADSNTALLSLVIMSCFRIGEGMIVLIAALQGMPPDYHQAASLDGAGRLQRFRFITLPLLRPWLFLLFLRDLLLSAQSTFTPIYMMTEGGPGYATTLLPYLVYDEAFNHLRIGHAATMMVVIFVVIATLLWLAYRTTRGWGYADEV